MNTQSSNKIYITITIVVIALVAVYFSLNKNVKVASENPVQVATSTTNVIGKPVIRKIDLPQALNINQAGTWTVYASSTDGKGLTYSATWGDEVITDPSETITPVKTNNPTFTHAYQYPGVYNPVITIYGSNGQSVYASAGARVLGETKKTPIIYSLSPSTATAGTLVTINGAGFTASKPVPNGPGTIPSNEVIFDGADIGSASMNGINSLYFIIPDTAKAGKHSIEIKNPNGKSNRVYVIVG